MSDTAEATRADDAQPLFEIATSRGFGHWLGSTGASLAITTYQSGKILLLGASRDGDKLHVFERTLDRPMGLAVEGRKLAVATLTQIITFVDAVEDGAGPDGRDAVYVPQVGHYTGDLDVHDMAWDAEGRLVFANTLFSCLATVSETHSFKPLWKPSFVSRLAAEDRCHLNGLALGPDRRPAYMTAVGETDVADGWREHRAGGGVVIDVKRSEIVAGGLSMPHSPRVYGGKLYVLNSGTGEFGTIGPVSRRFEPMCFLPGYGRGLGFIGNHAVIGLSEPRENKTFAGLPLQERLEAAKVSARCGLAIVDLATGDMVHWATFKGIVKELYDVAVLPGRRNPALIGFRTSEIRRVISVEPA